MSLKIRKPRGKNFTKAEEETLMEVMSPYIAAIEDMGSGLDKWEKKKEVGT